MTARDPDDEVVEAEIVGEELAVRRDVREGYGAPKSDQRMRLQHGKLYDVRVSQVVRVRARSPEEAENVAAMLSAGVDPMVHEVTEVDDEAVRAAQFERGLRGE